jgi:hypothetical protein
MFADEAKGGHLQLGKIDRSGVNFLLPRDFKTSRGIFHVKNLTIADSFMQKDFSA